jgi:hypothetical protein
MWRTLVMPPFDHHHYVPILKGKRGEFDALSWVEETLKGKNYAPGRDRSRTYRS